MNETLVLGQCVAKKRDSLKIELSTIPENSVPQNLDQQLKIGVCFRDLSYSVWENIFRKSRRRVLREISGDFFAGDLTCILGPSGCGKSTLMNILAGYTTKNFSGQLLTNEETRDDAAFQKQSCYILQNDHLQPLLTVSESMMTATNLKLANTVTHKEKKARVKEILESIGLWSSRRTKVCKLSGGQKKRLSIALELVRNPQVMFFDEPTSGLDSSATKQCVMLLKQLAQEGKTIICTIHQPSASVLEMFDHLYAISDGRCIYQGSVKGLVPYLEELGLQCPPYHNPADYLMEIATGDHGPHHLDNLVIKSENGKCQDWRRRQRDTLQMQSIEHINKMMKSGVVTPVKAPPLPFAMKRDAEVQTENMHKQWCSPSTYPSPFCHQVSILLKRTILISSRDPTLLYARIMTHFLVAILKGVLYFGIGWDAKDIMNNGSFLFFAVMFLMMTAFNCMILTFPSELPIIVRENFNRWYSIKAYYIATWIADTPIQIFAVLIYIVITYLMTGQPLELFRVVYFSVTCMLISLVSQSYGILIGAVLGIKNGVIFGPFFLLPFVIFSGFFVQLNDAHPLMRWVFHISFIKYSFEGLMLPIFGYDRGKLPCSQDYCHFVYPEKYLDVMDMEDAIYSHCVYFLVGLFFLIRVVTYFALKVIIDRR